MQWRCTYRFVGGLMGLHTYFITTNRTTYEHFRARYGGTGNPYDRHCPRNWGEVCCTRLARRIPENLVIPVRPSGPAWPWLCSTCSSQLLALKCVASCRG